MALTSITYRHVLCHYVVTVVIINFFMGSHSLGKSQHFGHDLWDESYTSLIEGTWTSRALIGGLGGGT